METKIDIKKFQEDTDNFDETYHFNDDILYALFNVLDFHVIDQDISKVPNWIIIARNMIIENSK
jgi:hypothetical protein